MDEQAASVRYKVRAGQDPDPFLSVMGFGVPKRLLCPVHVRGAVADRCCQSLERGDPGHVEETGVGVPKFTDLDVVALGPEVVAVDVHLHTNAAVGGDQLLLGGQFLADADTDVAGGRRSRRLPVEVSAPRFLTGCDHLGEGLGDEAADLLCGVGNLGLGLLLLVGREVEGLVFVDDRLPREVCSGRLPEFVEAVGGRRHEDEQVLVEAGAAVALGEDLSGQSDGRRVVVIGGVGRIGCQDHQANAVIVVGDVSGALCEHLHGAERAAVALCGDACLDETVGVAVVEVGCRPICCEPRHVGLQRIPILGAIHVKVRGLPGEALEGVGELADGFAWLHASEDHRLDVDAP